MTLTLPLSPCIPPETLPQKPQPTNPCHSQQKIMHKDGKKPPITSSPIFHFSIPNPNFSFPKSKFTGEENQRPKWASGRRKKFRFHKKAFARNRNRRRCRQTVIYRQNPISFALSHKIQFSYNVKTTITIKSYNYVLL